MWIFTEHGFFTFVVDRKDSSQVWLRARMREHLEDNFPGIEVTEHPGADYFFRAKVSKIYLAEQMTRLVMDANITSHFKDEMNRRAAKPKWGSISQVMYAVWNGAAQWQPYAPYAKVPRPEPKPWTPPAKGSSWTQPPGGFTRSPAGSQRASAFDWDSKSWGGTSAADPVFSSGPVTEPEVGDEVLDEVTELLLSAATEEEFEQAWGTLTDEERDAYLDAQEQTQRAREEIEEEFGAAARMLELHQGPDGWVAQGPDSHPAPRLTRSQRRAQRRREGTEGQEAQNRQAYLDKKAKRKGRKNRHNQQG